jgi:hypothetical protein
MQNTSTAKNLVKSKLTEGIIATLAFFGIYQVPLSAQRIWELLYRVSATREQVDLELERLVTLNAIVYRDGLYALREWDEKKRQENLQEMDKRWTRVRKYYWLLSAIPFVEHMSVINSLSLGTADENSDIDFFIITKPNRLYFVRSLIIIMFKLLRVYKGKGKINMKFCFGFYVSSSSMNIKRVMLAQEDPYLVFWMGSMVPIISLKYYERFMKENRWVYSWLPNFRGLSRLDFYRTLTPSARLKKFLEAVCYLPAAAFEPLLRKIHIKHTFKLPENHWATSTTIAERNILKLHALDPRKEIRQKFWASLRSHR